MPFLSVNDGVCDYDLCCDGSDEWAHVGGVKCEDRCKEIGKEWRKNDEQRKKSLGAASRKRKDLVAEAGRLRKQVEDRIQSLETEIQGSVLKVQSLETALADAERQERGKVGKSSGKASKIGSLIQTAKDRIEELRESLIELREQRDTGKSRLAELEGILSTFQAEYNPNFNDEGVKRAVRSWEEYAARDRPSIGNDAQDRDLDEIGKPDSETGVINWSDWEEGEESDVDVRKCYPTSAGQTRLLLTSLQSTKSRSTFLLPSGAGWISDFEMYASYSWRMASSRLRPLQGKSPKH